MNHENLYRLLIAKARAADRRRVKTTDPDYTAFHEHHIVPVCMGGISSPANLVFLTLEEHRIAHRLLVKMFPTVAGLAGAVVLLTKKQNVSEAAYDSAMRDYGAEKSRQQQLRADLGLIWSQSEEGKEAIGAQRRLEATLGTHPAQKPENRKAQSDQMTAVVTCPWCRKSGGSAGMRKSHFDYCKQNPNGKQLAKYKHKRAICFVCGREGGIGFIKRKHNDNCKFTN